MRHLSQDTILSKKPKMTCKVKKVCSEFESHLCNQGHPSPLRPWCISPPVSDFPPISEKFSDFLKNFNNLTFSRKISWLSAAKISDDLFLVIDHKFRISPLLSLFRYIFPPVSRKLFFPPYFNKFSLCFTQIHLLYTCFTCIFPPYFDHDAFKHHPMHVLDAPDHTSGVMTVRNYLRPKF